MSPWPKISVSAAVIVLGIIGACAPESEDSPSQSPEQVSVDEGVDMIPARTVQLLCSERQVLGDTRTFASFKEGYDEEVEGVSGVPTAKAVFDEILTRCQSPEQGIVEEIVDTVPARKVQHVCSDRQVVGDPRAFALFKKGYGEVEAGSRVPTAKAVFDEILTRCHR